MSFLPPPKVLRRENEFVGRAGRTRAETAEAARGASERQTEAQYSKTLVELRYWKTFFITTAFERSTTAERASGNVDTNFIDMLTTSAEQRVLPGGGRSPEDRHFEERLERAVRPQSVALAD